MDDMNDVDEFVAMAVAEIKGERARHPAPGGSVKGTDENPDDRKKPSHLTQWANFGGSFIASGDTVPTLPPDSYTLSITNSGQPIFVPQNIVTDDLLRLPDSKSDEVVAEVQHFWTIKDRFKKYGFSHKRGFLLWGPPGSGKTSTVSIITKDMVKSGGMVVYASDPYLLSLALKDLRLVEAGRPLVVVLEDLDTIIHQYGEQKVLSLLDGESQIENVCYIATTNYPENLDGRIINRPSRFDRIVKIGMPSAEAREVYLKSRIPETVVDGVDLVKETDGLSIAHLKELIVGTYCQERPVKEVLTRLQRMKVKPTSDKEMGKLGLA